MGHFSGHFAIRAWSFASSLVKQTRASASLLLSLVKLMAKITVYPSFKTVIDQKVDIFVSNLPSNQDILLRARTIDDSETVFESLQSRREWRSITGLTALTWRIVYRCRTHGVILEHGTPGRDWPGRYAKKTRCYKTPESFLRCLQQCTYWWEQLWVPWRK